MTTNTALALIRDELRDQGISNEAIINASPLIEGVLAKVAKTAYKNGYSDGSTSTLENP